MKQLIIILFILLTGLLYSQPIDTTGLGGTGGLTKPEVESLVGDSTYNVRLDLTPRISSLESSMSSKASTTLNNLGTTSISVALVPSVTTSWSLGSTTNLWYALYADRWISGVAFNTTVRMLPATVNRLIFFPDASGTVALGTGTANQLSYWSATNVLGGLPTTSYPSLAEISYVKGVTSAIQTQINGKVSSVSPTFTGTVILPSTTSIGSVDATELSYINGITSNAQNQLNAKLPVAFNNYTYLDVPTTAAIIPIIDGGGFSLSTTLNDLPVSSIMQDSLNLKVNTADTETSVYTLAQIELALNNLQGGTANQVLTKTDGDSLDYSWQDATGGTTRTKTALNIIEPGITDTFMVFWLDDAITIDSIKAETTDSIAIQIGYDKGPDYEGPPLYLFPEGTLITGTSTFTTSNFSTYVLAVNDKAYLYFTFISSATTNLKLKIYWRYL